MSVSVSVPVSVSVSVYIYLFCFDFCFGIFIVLSYRLCLRSGKAYMDIGCVLRVFIS